MNLEDLQDILPLVEQPSRYLGTEINRVKKDLDRVRLRIALAFPDLYEIGTSHFGLQILYDILNRRDDIAAERIFSPAPDMEEKLRSAGLPVSTLESGAALNRFDIIGFSLLYELDYTNILTLLDLADIPFLAADRNDTHPVVIAGGPCTNNPEPVADFFDAMVIGDGETVILDLADAWLEWAADGGSREDLLRAWSRIRGVYIPAFFEPRYDSEGRQTLLPRFEDYTTVERTVIPDLNEAPFPDAPVIPYGKPVHDRLRLEVARGCTRGCRFCQAGMIYRPVRERAPERLLDLTASALAATGYEDLSLLSLSTGDYHAIAPLMTRLMARCAADRVAVSLPSLRAGTLTPALMELIRQVRKTGFTIAPEAGSQRLRDVINKNITEADIIETVKEAFHAGWQVVKLYFMIGLPTETRADLQAMVDLVRTLDQIKRPKGGRGKINVSVGTFIPKPHTPFQWSPQLTLEESRQRIEWLREQFSGLRRVKFKWQQPLVSHLEGVWSRGDRRLSRLLTAAYAGGCRFDGWSDHFRYDLWQEAFAETGTDVPFYTVREREPDEPLPWDHIDIGVTKDYLRAEWEKAVAESLTPDCRDGDCQGCGVCDFETVRPLVYEMPETAESAPPAAGEEEGGVKTLQVSYAKEGQARFFGHLEMVNIFLRAIRRAGIPVQYSGGFHPMPKVAFSDSLPVGMASRNESFYMTVPGHVKPDSVVAPLDRELPEGLQVHGCVLAPTKANRKPPETHTYRVTLRDGSFDAAVLADFEDRPEMILTRTSRKGKVRKIDLKMAVSAIRLLSPGELEITLSAAPGQSVRPAVFLKEVFGLPDEAIQHAMVLKL